MNAYEFLTASSEDPAMNGKVLVFAHAEDEAEAKLMDATLNGAHYEKWHLLKVTAASSGS